VNVIGLDLTGNLAVGVSTSGYPWKYPGRVGDSALIGAGNYCDNSVGGAGCTGRGELAIRGNTARSVLLGLAAGHDPAKACAEALRETLDLPDEFRARCSTVPDPGRPARRCFHQGRVHLRRDDGQRSRLPHRREKAAMKIFLSSDMEGTAGVVAWDQCVGDGPEAAAGRRLLLDEVNAAIEGAVAGGATEVVVNDSHYQMRNLPPGALAGEASYISGSHKPLYMMQGLDASFDAVLFVSYHGSVGVPAGLSHTYSPRTVVEARINGTVTGEAGINALVAAHYGVPVVLVTGDRCACEETAALIPGVHTAVVKEHVSRLAAHRLHPARACQLIREAATKAVAGAAAAGPPPYATPVAWTSVRNTDIAGAATWVRGVDRTGPRAAGQVTTCPGAGRSPRRSC
jgi:D-amino peptidase